MSFVPTSSRIRAESDTVARRRHVPGQPLTGRSRPRARARSRSHSPAARAPSARNPASVTTIPPSGSPAARVEARRDQHQVGRERARSPARRSRSNAVEVLVVAAPGRQRHVHASSRPPVSGRARCPGRTATGGARRRARGRRPRKIAWCRCRGGRPSRRSPRARPRARAGRSRAAMATLLKRQKPMARSRSGVVPGRAHEREPADLAPPRSRSPAASSAASEARRRDHRVGVDEHGNSPRRAELSDLARRKPDRGTPRSARPSRARPTKSGNAAWSASIRRVLRLG